MSEWKRIGLREVRGLLPGEVIWDTAATGFAARRQKSEAVTYLVKYRATGGRQRRHTIGRHGSPWTPENALAEARRILGEVVRRALLYDVAEGRTAGKTKTAKKHGLARVTGGRKAATRAVGLLGAIFTYAVRLACAPTTPRMASNGLPIAGVLGASPMTNTALGDALRKADASRLWPPAVAAARFLALTGWRSGEALGLRSSEIDVARRTATLADTKTGRSIRPLPHAACDV